MAFVERDEFDRHYWAHAHAALAEGFCPDCGEPIASRELRGTGDQALRELFCTECETEWITVPGAPHPARFRAFEAIMRERRTRDDS